MVSSGGVAWGSDTWAWAVLEVGAPGDQRQVAGPPARGDASRPCARLLSPEWTSSLLSVRRHLTQAAGGRGRRARERAVEAVLG